MPYKLKDLRTNTITCHTTWAEMMEYARIVNLARKHPYMIIIENPNPLPASR